MRATWLADVLTDAGLVVRPYPGWVTRGGYGFRPVGIMWHHTVTPSTSPDATIDRFLAERGNKTTPAPLCNYSTNRDGTVSIIAAGTANHGGSGSWKGVSGNSRFFGDEMKNIGTGSEPWPARQVESARIAAAAILNHLDQPDAGMVCGHKEYATPPGRKTDPHSLNMNTERTRITEWMGEMMAWQKPGDPILNLADVKAVHAYQGNQVMSEADITYVETNPALLDNRWKIITARLLDIDMRP